MAKFKYVAIDVRGKSLSGEVEAPDQKGARQLVRSEGLTPLKLSRIGGNDSKVSKKPKKVIPFGKSEKSATSGSGKLRSQGERVGLGRLNGQQREPRRRRAQRVEGRQGLAAAQARHGRAPLRQEGVYFVVSQQNVAHDGRVPARRPRRQRLRVRAERRLVRVAARARDELVYGKRAVRDQVARALVPSQLLEAGLRGLVWCFLIVQLLEAPRREELAAPGVAAHVARRVFP